MRLRHDAGSPASLDAGPAVTTVGWLMAAWCLGFAAVNVAYVASGHFEDGDYAQYGAGLAVMSWLVLILKVVGAAIAVIAIRPLPRFASPRAVGVTLWGAAALLALYSVGNLVQLVGMLAGLMGSRHDITALGLAYVAFFILGAIGYGVLAVSLSRRYAITTPTAVVGALGAPVFLAVLLIGMPLLLGHLGLLPY